ncbi:hypothetical protein IKQ26_03705 [bacterium]|nr:hypothetical protein [bacterium]
MKKFLSVIFVLFAFVFGFSTQNSAEASPYEGYRMEVLNVIQNQIEQVYRQYNVNMYDIVKINRLNKYQKNSFIHATEKYRTTLFHGIQNLEFYKEDLIGMDLEAMNPAEANRRITEIRMKANQEYNNLDNRTQEYIGTCSYIMPTLSFQKFSREFKKNYVLHDLYLRNYSTILKIDQIGSKYKH